MRFVINNNDQQQFVIALFIEVLLVYIELILELANPLLVRFRIVCVCVYVLFFMLPERLQPVI